MRQGGPVGSAECFVTIIGVVARRAGQFTMISGDVLMELGQGQAQAMSRIRRPRRVAIGASHAHGLALLVTQGSGDSGRILRSANANLADACSRGAARAWRVGSRVAVRNWVAAKTDDDHARTPAGQPTPRSSTHPTAEKPGFSRVRSGSIHSGLGHCRFLTPVRHAGCVIGTACQAGAVSFAIIEK